MKMLVRHERMDPDSDFAIERSAQVVQEEITESELNSEVELLNSQDLLRKVVLANGLQTTAALLAVCCSANPNEEDADRESRAAHLGKLEGGAPAQDQHDLRKLRVLRSRPGRPGAEFAGEPLFGETSSGASALRASSHSSTRKPSNSAKVSTPPKVT